MAGAGRAPLHARRVREAWALIAPMALVLLCVAAWPLGRTIWLGFTDASLAGAGAGADFVGWENYYAVFGGQAFGVLVDPQWWRSVGNTLVFAGVSVSLETVLGVMVALVLHRRFPGRAWVRASVLVPWAIPTVVSAKMWAWMLNDQFGVVNAVLLDLGLIAQPLAWTADPVLSMVSVILVDVWKTTPFMALLVLAALEMLPRDIYEAARVDGIHPVRVFVRVTLPLIRPALVVAVVFRTLDALRVFDLVYVLTANSPATMTMSVYARRELIDFQSAGTGSAAATLVVLVIALVAVMVLTAGRARMAEARP
ncbi:carbohydrate ABC transporter permease [Roseospira navarrensis]|uniref:ABC transporter permease subunit n=1 Tax=Roseospira navarrensis TaxID=140058 RepID=A0A7X1ZDU6_9PROT|nr:sugar ABC transporter permease [Roseospira navarrensis]MQX35385.1 ABC transporter permease subunit [Roseospira navarrensis]